jgi:hypothetical protein
MYHMQAKQTNRRKGMYAIQYKNGTIIENVEKNRLLALIEGQECVVGYHEDHIYGFDYWVWDMRNAEEVNNPDGVIAMLSHQYAYPKNEDDVDSRPGMAIDAYLEGEAEGLEETAWEVNPFMELPSDCRDMAPFLDL